MNNNNRNNNRRRGRGNRNTQGGGNNQNRIDSRARGNAPQMLDKYKKLAQDAQHNGDRVQAEYYLQFADHYFRVIADTTGRQDEARAPRGDGRNDGRGQANDDYDDGDEDGDNRRKPNRRPNARRDDFDDNSAYEGEQGYEGEAASDDEVAAKPKPKAKRAPRKPKADDAGEQPRRKPRVNGRTKRDSAGSGAGSGEIDSAVLPPSISARSSADDDDNMKAVG